MAGDEFEDLVGGLGPQAQTVIAAAILRHLPVVNTTGQARDPDIATHGTRHRATTKLAA